MYLWHKSCICDIGHVFVNVMYCDMSRVSVTYMSCTVTYVYTCYMWIAWRWLHWPFFFISCLFHEYFRWWWTMHWFPILFLSITRGNPVFSLRLCFHRCIFGVCRGVCLCLSLVRIQSYFRSMLLTAVDKSLVPVSCFWLFLCGAVSGETRCYSYTVHGANDFVTLVR